jgi:hypothetical protein
MKMAEFVVVILLSLEWILSPDNFFELFVSDFYNITSKWVIFSLS